jgi:hypothetical protein
MRGRVIAAGVIACLALGARIESGQSRFEALDRSEINGVPGLRIMSVRDNVLKTCYAVFVAELADPGAVADRIEYTDIGKAMAVRDQRLGDLLAGFERERGAIPGTIAPNPLRYQWPADSAQVEFALTALNNAFARIEQELIRASRTAITAVPQPCGQSERAAH